MNKKIAENTSMKKIACIDESFHPPLNFSFCVPKIRKINRIDRGKSVRFRNGRCRACYFGGSIRSPIISQRGKPRNWVNGCPDTQNFHRDFIKLPLLELVTPTIETLETQSETNRADNIPHIQ